MSDVIGIFVCLTAHVPCTKSLRKLFALAPTNHGFAEKIDLVETLIRSDAAHQLREKLCEAVFPLTLRLIGECLNFLQTIVPKALKRRSCALNFTPIQYLRIPNVIFPQISRVF